MKIDMSPEAITRRLQQVDDLREACLSLADSSAGRRIRQKHPDNPVVQRTSQAIGDKPRLGDKAETIDEDSLKSRDKLAPLSRLMALGVDRPPPVKKP